MQPWLNLSLFVVHRFRDFIKNNETYWIYWIKHEGLREGFHLFIEGLTFIEYFFCGVLIDDHGAIDYSISELTTFGEILLYRIRLDSKHFKYICNKQWWAFRRLSSPSCTGMWGTDELELRWQTSLIYPRWS